jgi:hypothetical protein
MNSTTTRDSVLAVLALAAVLAVSFFSDLALFQLRLAADRGLNLLPYLWASSLAGLVICALALVVGYWLLMRASAHRLVGVIYLIAGGLVAIYLPLAFTFHLPFPLPVAIMSSSARYGLSAAEIMAVAGVFQLFRCRIV